MDESVRIEFREKLCIACGACAAACHAWRDPGSGVFRRRLAAREEGAFPNTRVRYLSLACRHCADPACARACPAGAIRKSGTGAVTLARERCTGCGQCAAACPFGAVGFDGDGIMVKCDLCQGVAPEERKYPCARTCPTGALTVKRLP